VFRALPCSRYPCDSFSAGAVSPGRTTAAGCRHLDPEQMEGVPLTRRSIIPQAEWPRNAGARVSAPQPRSTLPETSADCYGEHFANENSIRGMAVLGTSQDLLPTYTDVMIIQFSYLLFLCRVNSYKANYRHSTVQYT
jgi:hypothetical protein